MKLLIESAMIFFGTLMAAALVALGEPGAAAVRAATSPHAAASASPMRRCHVASTQPLAHDGTAWMAPARTQPSRGHPLWVKVLAGLLLLAVAARAACSSSFPGTVLRGPLNRYVSDKTGRHFEITRKLDVKLGRTTRILADGIEFANPEWARDPHLVKAEGAEIQIELLPLLRRRIELPLIELHQPQLGPADRAGRSAQLGAGPRHRRSAQHAGDRRAGGGPGQRAFRRRRTMAPTSAPISRSTGPATRPAPAASAAGSPAATAPAAAMPLSFSAKGTWQKEPFTAQGRTGNVLYLSAPLQQPFPMEVNATAGRTTLRASGSIASLATLDGADAVFNLQGHDLADLYKLVGVVLPATPRYSLQGHLSKQGEIWHVQPDRRQAGQLRPERRAVVRPQPARCRCSGQAAVALRSTSTTSRRWSACPSSRAARRRCPRLPGARPRAGALPAPRDAAAARCCPLPHSTWSACSAMNADVSYQAARISHAKQLPLDRMSVHVRLKDGVLQSRPAETGRGRRQPRRAGAHRRQQQSGAWPRSTSMRVRWS